MAHRRIGQDTLMFSSAVAARQSKLDKLLELTDWTPIERQLRDISFAAKGEPASPLLTLFKAMLIAVWHDLSDVRLAEVLDDRASFRRFCGFSAHEPTPKRTAFVRLRAQLVARSLDQVLFDAVTGQLVAMSLIAAKYRKPRRSECTRCRPARRGPASR